MGKSNSDASTKTTTTTTYTNSGNTTTNVGLSGQDVNNALTIIATANQNEQVLAGQLIQSLATDFSQHGTVPVNAPSGGGGVIDTISAAPASASNNSNLYLYAAIGIGAFLLLNNMKG